MAADSTDRLEISDLIRSKITGSPLATERLQELINEYRPILFEIAKLRALDLTAVHPAIVFEPTAAYRNIQ
jgi:hypothetical protein